MQRPDHHWSAVCSLGLCVASLTTAELLPVSLLTSMSLDLNLTEGVTGQVITVTAITALVASVTIGSLAGRLDRRLLMLSLAALQVGSSMIVALSANLAMLLAGRALLGIALGGFWAMGAALTTRLVPGPSVPKALSIVFGGAAVASVMAAPIGSHLSGLMGWREVFLGASAFSLCAFVMLAVSLPKLPAVEGGLPWGVLRLMKRTQLRVGLMGIVLGFGGHFVLFTYLRPFLELSRD